MGVRLYDASVLLDRSFDPPSGKQRVPEVRCNDQGEGIEFLSFLELTYRFIVSLQCFQEAVAIPMMRSRVIRVKLNRTLELAFGTLPLPGVAPHNCHRCMRFSKRVIDFEGFLRILHHLRNRLLWLQEAPVLQYDIAISQPSVSQCVAGVMFDGLFEVADGLLQSLQCPLVPEETSLQVEGVGLHICRRDLRDSLGISGEQTHLQRFRDFMGYVRLNLKDILQFSIVVLCPEMAFLVRIDELDADSHLRSRLPHAPLQHRPDLELGAYLLYGSLAALVFHDRGPGNHREFRNLRNRGDELLCHPIGKILVIRVRADVGERQDRDPPPVEVFRTDAAGPLFPGEDYLVHLQWRVDVLHFPSTSAHNRKLELVLYVIVDLFRQGDSSRVGQGLYAGGDVDRVSVDVILVMNDVSEVNPDAESDLPPGWVDGVSFVKRLLHFKGAPDGLECAREFHEKRVAYRLDLFAGVSREERTEEASMLFE